MAKILLVFLLIFLSPKVIYAGAFYHPDYRFGFHYLDRWSVSKNHNIYSFLTLTSDFFYNDQVYISNIYFSLEVNQAAATIIHMSKNEPQELLELMEKTTLQTTNDSCQITNAQIKTIHGLKCFIVSYDYIDIKDDIPLIVKEQLVYIVHNNLVHRLVFNTIDTDAFSSDWLQILNSYTQGLSNS